MRRLRGDSHMPNRTELPARPCCGWTRALMDASKQRERELDTIVQMLGVCMFLLGLKPAYELWVGPMDAVETVMMSICVGFFFSISALMIVGPPLLNRIFKK